MAASEGLLVAKRAAARGKDKEAIVELEALLELRKKQPPAASRTTGSGRLTSLIPPVPRGETMS